MKTLEIKNYKGFKHLKLENLARINLFAGKNNVGKSSLLEAINILTMGRIPVDFYGIGKHLPEKVTI